MNLGLAGKVALVSGSSRGIGHAIAKALWAEECCVAINGRNLAKLNESLAEMPERASAHNADVTDMEACRGLIRGVVERWGQLDILICNVGSGVSVPAGSETSAEWERILAVNLMASTNLVAAARSSLHAGASIICISSVCGVEALGAPIAYSAAKAALNAYVRGMARPLGAAGIRINAVAPGNILFKGGSWEARVRENPAATAAMLKREVALARFGEAEEIAQVVAFLASPCAAFVTGAIWIADGGQIRS